MKQASGQDYGFFNQLKKNKKKSYSRTFVIKYIDFFARYHCLVNKVAIFSVDCNIGFCSSDITDALIMLMSSLHKAF